jgi:hypothetical protein
LRTNHGYIRLQRNLGSNAWVRSRRILVLCGSAAMSVQSIIRAICEVGVEEHRTDVAFPAWTSLKHVTYPACQSIPVAELGRRGFRGLLANHRNGTRIGSVTSYCATANSSDPSLWNSPTMAPGQLRPLVICVGCFICLCKSR